MAAVGGTVIIIPARNEAEWIGRTIDLVRTTGVEAHIIVVNDGSTDKTSQVAMKKKVDVINLPKNRGKTAAVFTGLKEALKRKPKRF